MNFIFVKPFSQQYHILKKHEQHLPWVENIIHADSLITSFGTYSDTIHGGILTGKPVDYETPEHPQSLP